MEHQLRYVLFSFTGEHLPRRLDSILVHPETMRLCGMGIGQLVAVRSVDSNQKSPLTVCKPWPFKNIELDGITFF